MDTNRSSRPLAAAATAAARRHGVLTMSEALDCGLTSSQIRTLIDRGDWQRPVSGVLVSSAAPRTWFQQAAIAAAASNGALSHRSAAFIHGLDGIARPKVELLVHKNQNRRSGNWVTHRSASIAPHDLAVVKGLAVTSIARTIVDLGAVVSDDKVEQVLDDALRRGTPMSQITRTLEQLDSRGRPGCAALKRVLGRPDRRGPLPDSKFERLLQRACVEAGIPEPVRQVPVHDDAGRLIARIDAGWPEAMLGVEADSRRWHGGISQIRSDNKRDLLLMGLGWELCYLGWSDALDPSTFTATLATAYYRRLQLHADTPRSR